MTEIKLPRLLAAAKEFNIGQDTLIDFLIGKSFPKDDLKPTSKLSDDMYRALQLEFQSDKAAKMKSDQVDLPKGSQAEAKKKKEDEEINFKKEEKKAAPKKEEPVIVEEKPALTIFNKMDLYEEKTFDKWLEEPTKADILEDLYERWNNETNGNAVFVAAIEKRNLAKLRDTILEKVREIYKVRYPYKSEFLY